MASLRFRLAKESTLTVDIESNSNATIESLRRLIAQLTIIETALAMHDREQSNESSRQTVEA